MIPYPANSGKVPSETIKDKQPQEYSMFHSISTALKTFLSNHKTVDTSQFNDPIASQIEWSPMTYGVKAHQHYKLEEKPNGISLLVPQWKSSIPGWLYLLIPMGLMFFFTSPYPYFDDKGITQTTVLEYFKFISFEEWLGVVLTPLILFVLYPIHRVRRGRKYPVAFDRYNKELLRGVSTIPFGDIYGFQIIYKRTIGTIETSSYSSSELNLVLKNGIRLHLIADPSLKSITDTAEQIVSFLKVPIWSNNSSEKLLNPEKFLKERNERQKNFVLTPELKDEILGFLAAGRKIDAIKAANKDKIGLRAAKELVDSLEG